MQRLASFMPSGPSGATLAGHGGQSTDRLMFALICAFTLLFLVLTPPFQSPDESQHYMKALALAEGRVRAVSNGREIGAMLPRAALDLRDSDFPAEQPGELKRYAVAQVGAAWHADAGREGQRFADFPNVANYAPTLYAPQALGLWAGEAIGLPRIGAFYAGRLANAAVALLMLLAAVMALPFGRMALLAAAALPTSVCQAASLSPDATINGLGWLALALSLRLGFRGARGGSIAGALALAPFLALAKGVYLPLMLAGMRWPSGALAAKARPMRTDLLLIGAAILGAAVFVGWMKYSGGTQALYHIVSRKTGELVLTAPLADQLAVVLGDPIGYLHILMSSMAERAPVYGLQIVGRFGWNSILLPLAAYPLALLMLGSAWLGGEGPRAGLLQRLWWLSIAGGVAVLVETALYLTGTPLGANYIQGVQGRYFLPILPLAILAIMPAGGATMFGTRRMRRSGVLAASVLLAIAALTALDAFWIHGFVTHDGMPPGSGALRMILLPSQRWVG
jgi:uncharacterized membrane protein